MSTETIRSDRDWEAQDGYFETVTHLLSSELSSGSMLIYFHRDHKDDYGLGAQDGYTLDVYAAHEFLVLCLTSSSITVSRFGLAVRR